jgi:hypothetical protein
MFICDVCDTPVNHAREIHLAPRKEAVQRMPSGTAIATITLAFCAKCMTNKEATTKVTNAAAKELNEWVDRMMK